MVSSTIWRDPKNPRAYTITVDNIPGVSSEIYEDEGGDRPWEKITTVPGRLIEASRSYDLNKSTLIELLSLRGTQHAERWKVAYDSAINILRKKNELQKNDQQLDIYI